MGQQQLLLIVLGTLIIGVAVVVAIIIFNQKSVEVKKDNITQDLLTLANMAQQYFRKPELVGGGGGTFISWDVPDGLKATANATYNVETSSVDVITIRAVSTEIVTGSEHLVMYIDVTPTTFSIRDE